MSMLDSFERKGLFRLTRFLALVIVISLIIGAGLGILAAYSKWPKHEETLVSPSEVVAKVREKQKPLARSEGTEETERPFEEADPLEGVVIPKTLETEFAPLDYKPGSDSILMDPESRMKNRKILADRMDDMSLSKAERQAYINELAAAVAAAKGQGLDRVDVINAYLNLKQEKVEGFKAAQAEAKEMRLWAAGIVVAVLFLIALFSLVLVLLAIERNTRPVPQPQ